jgi:hypothetical protein
MKTLMFYNNVQPLNKEAHKNLRLEFLDKPNFAFASETNSVMIALTELALISKHYVTAFAALGNPEAEGEQQYALACVLGMRDNENVYVGQDGEWSSPYIPAFVRRYPFVIAENEDQFTVCIDQDFPQFNDKKGEPLFSEAGEPTELLQRNIDFLQAFQRDALATQNFIAALKELDLLEQASSTMQLNSGETLQLNGLYLINEKKLNELSAEQVKNLMTQGYLGLIYAHLLSLNNFNDLMDRMAGKLNNAKAKTTSAVARKKAPAKH